VTLGLGSVVASAVTAVPWLATFSRHKGLVFGAAGVLMALNYWLVVIRPRRCEPGEICHVDSPLMRWNRRIYWFSAAVYVSALVLTYASLFVLERM
jgi:mercuric ion transport protein